MCVRRHRRRRPDRGAGERANAPSIAEEWLGGCVNHRVGLRDCFLAESPRPKVCRADGDPTRIAIGGTSAGGGLAASLALLAVSAARCPGLSAPSLPDARRSHCGQARPCRAAPMGVGQRLHRFGWRSYLGTESGTGVVSSLAAPARTGDLAGLPPAGAAWAASTCSRRGRRLRPTAAGSWRPLRPQGRGRSLPRLRRRPTIDSRERSLEASQPDALARRLRCEPTAETPPGHVRR